MISRFTTKRIFTAALVFWMSGVIVLFCCGTMPARAAEIESCPLAKKGNCSKSVKEIFPNFSGLQSNWLDCCATPAKIFDKARKIEKSPEIAVAAAENFNVAAPKFFLIVKSFGAIDSYRSFIRRRSDTYLRNCVFRN